MAGYLIDTNVISDYLAASLPVAGMTFMDQVIDAIPKISVITQIELLCWKTNQALYSHVQEFTYDSTVLPITPNVVAHCVRIRRQKRTKTPDAIIAATALANNLAIITHNVKDFDRIHSLEIVDPFVL